jgi:hypothetical protein
MTMKSHLLAALREEFDRWEELLGGLTEAQRSAPQPPDGWSVKDDLAHLWAWQQRSIARADAARLGGEPVFPSWPATVDPDTEDGTDPTNAWIYETNREVPWATVHQRWRDGYLRFLEAAETIAERDLLDASRYPWLEGHALAAVLLGSYDHHREHRETLLERLERS